MREYSVKHLLQYASSPGDAISMVLHCDSDRRLEESERSSHEENDPSIDLLITNETTGRAKVLHLCGDDLDLSIFESIYHNHDIKIAKILEWPSDLAQAIGEDKVFLEFSVFGQFGESIITFSEKEMREYDSKHLLQYAASPDDAVNVVLQCKEKREDSKRKVEGDTKLRNKTAKLVDSSVSNEGISDSCGNSSCLDYEKSIVVGPNVDSEVEGDGITECKFEDMDDTLVTEAEAKFDKKVEEAPALSRGAATPFGEEILSDTDPIVSQISSHHASSRAEVKASLLQFQSAFDKKQWTSIQDTSLDDTLVNEGKEFNDSHYSTPSLLQFQTEKESSKIEPSLDQITPLEAHGDEFSESLDDSSDCLNDYYSTESEVSDDEEKDYIKQHYATSRTEMRASLLEFHSEISDKINPTQEKPESQWFLDDQKYGSMYAKVYKSLKYKTSPKHKPDRKQPTMPANTATSASASTEGRYNLVNEKSESSDASQANIKKLPPQDKFGTSVGQFQSKRNPLTMQQEQNPDDRFAELALQNETMSRDEMIESLRQFQCKMHTKGEPVPPPETRHPRLPPDQAKRKEMFEREGTNNALEVSQSEAKSSLSQIQSKMMNLEKKTKQSQARVRELEQNQDETPRDEMIESLKHFQSHIQGRLRQKQEPVIGEKEAKDKVLEDFETDTSNATNGMEVTEQEYLSNVDEELKNQRNSLNSIPKKYDFWKHEIGMKKTATKIYIDGNAHLDEEQPHLSQSDIQSETETERVKNIGNGKKESLGKYGTSEAKMEPMSPPTALRKLIHPRKFESMLRNLEDLKKRNEEKVQTMQSMDRMREQSEEKVSAMLSTLTPEEANEIPSWFKEFAKQQEEKLQELTDLSEQRNAEISRLNEELLLEMRPSLGTEKSNHALGTYSLEQLETRKNVLHALTEGRNIGCPRHAVGCTSYECHGALMEKDDFGVVRNADTSTFDTKFNEASNFINTYAKETGMLRGQQIEDRLEQIKNELTYTGVYVHSFEELQFGCRLAWQNSGRCILRKVSFSLEIRDCRQATTAEECFEECVEHLVHAFNKGAIKPIISVFRPKLDGESAPVRIWNRHLLGYAAYRRNCNSIMGDPMNLGFTALCVKFGWCPPAEKSDFDVLPWLISDNNTGHDKPKVFDVPANAIEEVEFDHPDFDLFEELNLRWYALPCISNIGIDIGGKIRVYAF
jgi:hypothetical protein